MTCYGENLTPYLEYTKSPSSGLVQETPYLVNQQKYEQFINYEHQYGQKTQNLLQLHRGEEEQKEQWVDQLVQYLSDPLQVNQEVFSQNTQKRHPHLVDNVTRYYSHPSFSTNHRFTANFANKAFSQYQMISVSNDRNISVIDFQLGHQSDSVRVSGYHVNSPVSREVLENSYRPEARKYQGLKLNETIQLTELHEGHKTQLYDEVNHQDWITDFVQVDRERQSYLFTASRDKTIKLWK